MADVYWVHRRFWEMSCLFFLQFVLRNMFLYFVTLAYFSPSLYHLSPSMMTLSLLFACLFPSLEGMIQFSFKQCSILYYQAIIPLLYIIFWCPLFMVSGVKVRFYACSSTGPALSGVMFHIPCGFGSLLRLLGQGCAMDFLHTLVTVWTDTS